MNIYSSQWLIYNKYNSNANTNQFKVIFASDLDETDNNATTNNSIIGDWNGVPANNQVKGSNRDGAGNSNKRLMW